jgi:hypothetical protein
MPQIVIPLMGVIINIRVTSGTPKNTDLIEMKDKRGE